VAAAPKASEAGAYNVPAMIDAILKKIFGTKHERDVKRMMPVVAEINALEPAIQALDDAALRGKTDELRKRLADGAEIEDVLPEAFAVCREAARRSVGMRHFDVQLIGGMVLHNGTIAEMATGEGKTLVATLPAYLNALTGKGVHIVTVNDYLAKRDAQWMGPLYHALGLTVGVIQHEASFQYDPAFVTSDIRMTALKPIGRRDMRLSFARVRHCGWSLLRLPCCWSMAAPRYHPTAASVRSETSSRNVAAAKRSGPERTPTARRSRRRSEEKAPASDMPYARRRASLSCSRSKSGLNNSSCASQVSP